MSDGFLRRAWWALGAAFALALLVFTLWPGIDLAVSAVFYRPDAGFWLAGNFWLEALRQAIWDLSILVFVLSLVALALAAAGRPIGGFGARPAGFLALLYLIGPILVVNGLLKAHWGRARPANVTDFGGPGQFTPPWLPTDQCLSNCSFVSGEGAAGMALAISFLVLAPLMRRVLPRAAFRLYALLGVVLPVMGAAMRVMTGRHFLSDVIFAALIVLAVALALSRLLLERPRG